MIENIQQKQDKKLVEFPTNNKIYETCMKHQSERT